MGFPEALTASLKGRFNLSAFQKLLFILLTTKGRQSKPNFQINVSLHRDRSDIDRTSFWKRPKLCCFVIMFSICLLNAVSTHKITDLCGENFQCKINKNREIPQYAWLDCKCYAK